MTNDPGRWEKGTKDRVAKWREVKAGLSSQLVLVSGAHMLAAWFNYRIGNLLISYMRGWSFQLHVLRAIFPGSPHCPAPGSPGSRDPHSKSQNFREDRGLRDQLAQPLQAGEVPEAQSQLKAKPVLENNTQLLFSFFNVFKNCGNIMQNSPS